MDEQKGSPGWVGAKVGGAGRVFAGNSWGGGLKVFFFGAEIRTKKITSHVCIGVLIIYIHHTFS